MALQGTIETFALPDVLRLLASSNKTGKLAVNGERGLGALWVDDGDIVASEIDLGSHPSTGSTDATEGLFQLLRFETGEFVFTSDEAPTSTGDRLNVESSIAASTEMLAELDEITNNVPGVSSHVALRPELDADGVTLSAEQWRVLSAVGSGTSVADIAATFSFGELDAMRRVDDLVGEGVIDISEGPAEAAAASAPVMDADFAATEEVAEEPAFNELAEEPSVEEPVFEEKVFEEKVFEEAVPEEPAVEETVAEDTPAEDTVAEDTPAEDIPAEDIPAEDIPAEDIPAEDIVAEDTAADDPFAPVAEADDADPFAAPEAESGDPFAAPAVETDDPFAAVAETDAADPFAAPEADQQVDAFAAPASETPAADPFAPAEPEVEAVAVTESFEAQSLESTDSTEAEFDPFARTAELADDDSAGIDPFAPAAAVAAGATGGVLHDVFGSSESEADASWEPSADEATSQAPTEWPAPNDTASDADAPWSDEAASQLPPPPAAASDNFAPVDEAASQLPPPPAMAGDAGIDPASAVDPASVDPASVDPASVDPASVDPASVDPAAAFDAPAPLGSELEDATDSELPPPPAFDAPEAEVAGVPSFPEAPPVPEVQSVASESNDMARQLASLSPSAARAVANAAKAETPEARDAALAEVEAEDSSVDRSLLLRFLGKSDKKES